MGNFDRDLRRIARRDIGRIFVQMFDVALAAWSGHRQGCVFEKRVVRRWRWSTTAMSTPAIAFPPNYLLGNMQDPVDRFNTGSAVVLWQTARHAARFCRECEVRFATVAVQKLH
jgi:sulfatase maturation enzyme AslB (radical SAM superfamily)